MSPSWINFSNSNPCLGVALGRESAWAVRKAADGDGAGLDWWCERIALVPPLDPGNPGGPSPGLSPALKPILERTEGDYTLFQVALPDPVVRFEVFELDQIPARGKSMDEFLSWRFNAGKEGPERELSFSHQLLGGEEGKHLLLGLAVEKNWVRSAEGAFLERGLAVSAVDIAFNYRFNLFRKALAGNQGGALITLEPEYWSLGIWDGEMRPRFLRAKWWGGEPACPADIPMDRMALEVERTIRSYLYSGRKRRAVEEVYLSAPRGWLGEVLERLEGMSLDGISGLALEDFLEGGGRNGLSPSAVAAAVAR